MSFCHHCRKSKFFEEGNICEECQARICHSIKDKCQIFLTCNQCKEKYHPCRAVNVWSGNLEDKGKRIVYGGKGAYIYSYNIPNQLVVVCAFCAQKSGITHSWKCKSDYLNDHSLAKCCSCNMINLSSGKKWGRGPCCNIN